MKYESFIKGFTLVELIVVFSIIAILSAEGISAFVNYGDSQTMATSMNDVISVLQLAKFRAQSQVIFPGSCASPSPSLVGYKVVVTSAFSYQLVIDCAPGTGSNAINTYSLPSAIQFSYTSAPAVEFYSLTGVASLTNSSGNNLAFTLSGYSGSYTRYIYVCQDGRITQSNSC